MPTIKEFRQEQANKLHAEQTALVAVIRRRTDWHQEQLVSAEKEYEKKWYNEFCLRDEELLEEAKRKFAVLKERYDRGGIDFPDIDFSLTPTTR